MSERRKLEYVCLACGKKGKANTTTKKEYIFQTCTSCSSYGKYFFSDTSKDELIKNKHNMINDEVISVNKSKDIKTFDADVFYDDEADSELIVQDEEELNNLLNASSNISSSQDNTTKTATKPKISYDKNTEELGFDYKIFADLYENISHSMAGNSAKNEHWKLSKKESVVCAKSLTSVLNRRVNTENGDIWGLVISHALVFVPRGIKSVMQHSDKKKKEENQAKSFSEPTNEEEINTNDIVKNILAKNGKA